MDAERVAAWDGRAGCRSASPRSATSSLHVSDIERSTKFYTEVLGFKISDIYAGDEMLPGGAVFLRCQRRPSRHRAVPGHRGTPSTDAACTMSRSRSSTLDEVVRVPSTCASTTCRSTSTAAAAPGCSLPSSSATPTATGWRSTGASTRSAATIRSVPPEEWKGATSLEAAIADPVKGQDTTLADPTLLQA